MASGKAAENKVSQEVIAFLKENHVACLSMRDEPGTWSSSCFYVYYEKDPSLIFLSHEDTRHASLMRLYPEVSGSIAAQQKQVIKIQGIQFKGYATVCENKDFRSLYNRRFALASLVKAQVWVIRLELIKYTSNLITFGNKIYWHRN